jgi:hypothetical protein
MPRSNPKTGQGYKQLDKWVDYLKRKGGHNSRPFEKEIRA